MWIAVRAVVWEEEVAEVGVVDLAAAAIVVVVTGPNQVVEIDLMAEADQVIDFEEIEAGLADQAGLAAVADQAGLAV